MENLENGISTTPFSPVEVLSAFDPYFDHLILDGITQGRSNGHIYIGMRKKEL
uniref:Uncharacterized protein n=1 Tax=viral metagenome TaxID=1070528 RepID=A0A6M3J907_9ZZZZ